MIRLLIADDQKSVRRGLRMSLGLEPDFAIVGEAPDGRSAVELAHQLLPDVIVMDISMPVLDGIASTRILRAEAPGVKVVMLSLHDDRATRSEALNAGAVDFVSKQAPAAELSAAIRRAAAQPAGYRAA